MQTGKGISIPSILKVGKGALTKIGSYLKNEGIEQAVIFFGNGLIDMFGTDVMNSLKQEDIKVLEYSELDTVDIDEIITLAFAMPNKTQAVISIGGGKVIDAGKYAAFLRNLPFISVPTSSSSDGFSSASASLLVHGKRFGSGTACLRHYCGHTGHKNCTGEVYLFRDRRYDLKDHSTL